jgi:hypothetical protein
LRAKGKYKSNSKSGRWKYYYSNGKLERVGKHSKTLIFIDKVQQQTFVVKYAGMDNSMLAIAAGSALIWKFVFLL